MMKKYTSVASLALTQTAFPAALVMLLAGLLQWLLYQPASSYFENTLGLPQYLIFLGGLLALAAVLIIRCCSQSGTQCNYRLYLLQVSPNTITFLRAFIFAGYFFLYLVSQLAMIFAMYFRFLAVADPSAVVYQGKDILFLLSYRNSLFHTLLPLADWPGYLRNLALCVGFGCISAFLSHLVGLYKRPKFLFWAVFPVLAALLWLPTEMTQWQSCLYFSLVVLGVSALLLYHVLGGVSYED